MERMQKLDSFLSEKTNFPSCVRNMIWDANEYKYHGMAMGSLVSIRYQFHFFVSKINWINSADPEQLSVGKFIA